MSENICPICHNSNQCMAKSEKPCWCNNTKVPQGLLDLVPENQKGKSCICLSCIEKFNSTELSRKS